jgi:two-component system response regulator PilR (NtrC family)
MQRPMFPRRDENRAGGAPSGAQPPNLQAVDADARARTRLLVVDDETTLRESCVNVLTAGGYDVTSVGRGDEAHALLSRRAFDVVLLDLYMSQVDGRTLLKTALTTSPATLVIVMTGEPSIESSLEVMQAGAWDYLPKPFSAAHLQVLIGRAAHTVQIGRESDATQSAAKVSTNGHTPITLLGTSPAFRRAVELARRVAPTDASVFITGESGCGKELIAQFTHQQSRRATRPFVALNCAALPEPLLESEMFGHRKGAFTGAVRDKPGLLESANGGTLFLDELADMPKLAQAKLLRVLQDGVVRRVGSEETDAVVNVRIICATNRDPEEAVRAGDLREDLYYRLRVVPIHIPPLRERTEDIPLLADFFFHLYWKRRRVPGDMAPELTEGALRALVAHPWRGNVRELQNVMEHVAVLAEPGVAVTERDLPLRDDVHVAAGTKPTPTTPTHISEIGYHPARDRVIAEFEMQYLSDLLERARGNMSEAARIAGVDRTTLYRLMERHGLHRHPHAGLVRTPAEGHPSTTTATPPSGTGTPRESAAIGSPGDAYASR